MARITKKAAAAAAHLLDVQPSELALPRRGPATAPPRSPDGGTPTRSHPANNADSESDVEASIRNAAGMEVLPAETAIDNGSPDSGADTPAMAGAGEPADPGLLQWIPLYDILPSPWQTRLGEVDEDALESLADDIARNGLMQEPAVRPGKGGRYELVYGHRRLEALKLLARKNRQAEALRLKGRTPYVRVKVRSLTESEARARTISENMRRKDLSPWEEVVLVEALTRMYEQATKQKATIRPFSDWLARNKIVGDGRGWVEARLRVATALNHRLLGWAGLMTERSTLTLPADDLRRAVDPALLRLSMTQLLEIAKVGSDHDRAAYLRFVLRHWTWVSYAAFQEEHQKEQRARVPDERRESRWEAQEREAREQYGLHLRVADIRRMEARKAVETAEILASRLVALAHRDDLRKDPELFGRLSAALDCVEEVAGRSPAFGDPVEWHRQRAELKQERTAHQEQKVEGA